MNVDILILYNNSIFLNFNKMDICFKMIYEFLIF